MRALSTSWGFLTAGLLYSGAALALEEPRYQIEKRYEHFEVRRYDPVLLAETQVSANFDDAGNQAFRILADFIFGENRQREKIAMTAPVTREPSGQRIAMTAPVTQQANAAAATYTFAFVMPREFTRETLPEPTDPRVSVREVPERRLAALTYSGFWSEGRYREHEQKLLRAVEGAGLQTVGEPIFARYNAPWTPWFWRRNEVLIELAPGQ